MARDDPRASNGHDPHAAPDLFEPPGTPSFLTGVYLVVNGVRDLYLVVDGPNCVFFRIPQLQANHDWQADLARSSGLHRIVDTDATPTRVTQGDTALLRERLQHVDRLPDCSAILLTAMSHVAITGRQYEVLLEQLEAPLTHPLVRVPDGSLAGDWLDGYTRTLEALARELPLPRREDPGDQTVRTVAVVGHLHHRNEADVRADGAELRRLLEGLGLSVVSLWPEGGTVAGLQGACGADLVVSLPYAGAAGALLAERLGVPVVEAELPVGLAATGRFVRTVGEASGRGDRAQALVDEELAELIPQLAFVLDHELFHKRVLVAADRHLTPGLGGALAELGCEVALEATLGRSGEPTGEGGAPPDAERVEAERLGELRHAVARVHQEEAFELAVVNSDALEAVLNSGSELPFLEVGFPAYHTHALHPQPLLGYAGVACLVTRLINEIRQFAASRRK